MIISVIIPVYNVEKYIPKCLESVLNQTYNNLEIILIDDGSTDSSGSICDKYALGDQRIKVVHKKNGGLMSAWIVGLSLATGEYTTFVDSDDWVDIDMISKFTKCVSKKKYDLVISNHIQEYDGKSIPIKEKCPKGVYGASAIDSEIYPVLLNDNSYFGRGLNLCRWAKLIKTELIKNNIKYCDTRISYGEDVNIMFPIFLDCKKIYIMNEYLYHYRQNQNSIMNSYKRNMELQIDALNEALKLVNIDKRRYNFDMQIKNNFLCMVMALIRNEFRSDARKRDIISSMIRISDKSEVKSVLDSNNLAKLSRFDKLIIKGIIYKSRMYFYMLLYVYRMKRCKNMFKVVTDILRGKSGFIKKSFNFNNRKR